MRAHTRSISIFLIALAIRLWAIQQTFPQQHYFGKYLALGQELLSNGFTAVRPFSYSPAYCYFIAFCQSIVGDSLLPILILQAVIGAGTCVLIHLIGKELLGEPWALFPAAIACVYRSFVLYDVTLLSDSLGLFILMALVLALYRVERNPGRMTFAVIGGLLGLSLL